MESFREWNEGTEESGFLDQIFLKYPDKTPALAYADWLDDHESNLGPKHNSHFANYIRANLNHTAKEKISVTQSLPGFNAWNFANNLYIFRELLWFHFNDYSQIFVRRKTFALYEDGKYSQDRPKIVLERKTYLSCAGSTVSYEFGKAIVEINGDYTYPYDPPVTNKQAFLATLIYNWDESIRRYRWKT